MLYVLIAIIIAIFGGLIEKLIKSELESINYCTIAMIFVLSLLIVAKLGMRVLPDIVFSMAEKNEKVETYVLSLNPNNEYYDVHEKGYVFYVHGELENNNKNISLERDVIQFKEGENANIAITKTTIEWSLMDTLWFLFQPPAKEFVSKAVCTFPRNDCINDDVRKYCTNCQMEIKSTWNFCSNCGEKLRK